MTRAELEQYVKERIYPNNAQEITGEVLQNTLLVIVASMLERGDIDQDITEAIDTLEKDLPFRKGEGFCSARLVGSNNIARDFATAEGYETSALATCSHSEGHQTKALDYASHAEGDRTSAEGLCSHAEGETTSARGKHSHAEGISTIAEGNRSHAEGYLTHAIGSASHAEGYNTNAIGNYSHTTGRDNTASNNYEFACGRGNVSTTSTNKAQATRFSIGIGTLENPNNAFEVKENGDVYINGLDMSLQEFLTDLENRIMSLEG